MELIFTATTIAMSIGVGLAGTHAMLSMMFLLMSRAAVRAE